MWKTRKEEIKDFVVAQCNNVFERYYYKCPECNKSNNTFLNISKTKESFDRHRKKLHFRMKVTPKIVQHNYPDIGYLTSKELYILWLSLAVSKRYSKDDDEKEVYNLCAKYVEDVIEDERKK